jgi:hypothetical protein
VDNDQGSSHSVGALPRPIRSGRGWPADIGDFLQPQRSFLVVGQHWLAGQIA